jgi:hypothetical protein
MHPVVFPILFLLRVSWVRFVACLHIIFSIFIFLIVNLYRNHFIGSPNEFKESYNVVRKHGAK